MKEATRRPQSLYAAGPIKINMPYTKADEQPWEQMEMFDKPASAGDDHDALTFHTLPTTGVDAILEERGSRYGKFTGHAAVTQAIKSVMFNTRPDLELAPDQREALEMIAHKIGRIINGDPNYADSWVDIAGYAKLVADRLEGVEK